MIHEVPLIWLAALRYLADELEIASFNKDNNSDLRPFDNTAQEYKCPAFEVEAYDWSEEEDEEGNPINTQEYNFKWRDVKIKWYKYLGRGMEANKELTAEEAELMLEECLNYLNEQLNLKL